MKQLILMFSLVAIAASADTPVEPKLYPGKIQGILFVPADNYFKATVVDGDNSAIEFKDANETLTIRTGGKQTAPSISLRRDGQGFFLAALKFGAILSMYRNNDAGEKREWLRLSYSGVHLFDDDGTMQEGYTGKIGPGCSAVVRHGWIVGEECK